MANAQHKNNGAIVKRAQTLRQNGSLVERILWRHLRNSCVETDLKFRYQHPLSIYVVDFICLTAKLVIEIDGISHDSTPREDQKRQRYIEKRGYQILRFSNQDVIKNVSSVVETIIITASDRLNAIHKKDPSPKFLLPTASEISTLPQGEGDSVG